MDIRTRLAQSTRAPHEALHGHALFAPMFDGAARWSDLQRVLSAFALLFQTVEAARLGSGRWPDLGLDPELTALRADLRGASGGPPDDILPRPTGDLAVLGALYVAHGASFGRSTLGRAVPDLAGRSRFLGLRPDPDKWRLLAACLEREGHAEGAFDRLHHGASEMFAGFARVADHCARPLPVGDVA